jgi:AbiV family abortive infection protein
MADLPTPYRGTLDAAQIAAGMNLATSNASRLASDARLLLENKRWPSAASIAALSIEESGKVVILRRFLTATDEEVKSLWKSYRSHTKKNTNWILPDLVSKGAKTLEDFRPMIDGTSDHPATLDTIKQLGFYSDCLENAHWSDPESVVDEVLATQLVKAAEILSPARVVTVRELELWVKHMAPVWNKSADWMKTALVNWYAEMQAEGLVPSGENSMAAFVREGLNIRQAKQMGGAHEA